MNELTLADVVQTPGPGNRRRSARAAERRRKSRRRRTWVSALIGLAVIAGALGVAWLTLRPMIASFNEPKDWPGPGTGEVTVTVESGASVTTIGQTLQKQGVVKTVGAFVDAVSQQPGSGNAIQPGVYKLKLQMAAGGALAILDDPVNRIAEKVTIQEGKRLTEILQALAATGKLDRAALDAAVKNPSSIDLPPEAGKSVEGWLFPATYEITPNTTPTSLLTDMVHRTEDELTSLGVSRDKWLSTLTFASLVQAESGNNEDSPKIARVLQNRIDKKVPLQLDTTVNYAMNRYKVAVTDKDTTFASPYNTYLHPGLPPGPIDSPGSISIQAALHPTAGPWMYFVAVNPSTGLTKFGVTPADFAKLKAELNDWLKTHPNN